MSRPAWSGAAVGIGLFALNKVLLASLNGLRRMRWFAILSAGRFLFMLAAFAVCVRQSASAGQLPVILTAAEAGTFLLAVIACRDLAGLVPIAELRIWVRRHVSFGSRAFMSGVASEINTRVDIIMLGALANDAVVGIYSFAAIIAEGLFQLLVVLRNNYAPIVARLFSEGEREQLTALIRRGRNRTYLAAFPIAALAVAGYALLVPILTSEPGMDESWIFFAILIAGMSVSSGYIPFSHILLYGQRPGAHTYFLFSVVGINIVANAALIGPFGATGAAAATAGALVMSVVIIRVASRRLLSISL